MSLHHIWVVANVLTATVDPLTECLLKLAAAASLRGSALSRNLHLTSKPVKQNPAEAAHVPSARIFFLIPVFSSTFPRKSVTMFSSLRNLSTRSLIDEKMSIRPMVLDQVLSQGPGSGLGSSLQLKVGSAAAAAAGETQQNGANPPNLL